ncbi:hypothetical protein ACJMK2_000950, partial [Sinanodonta woodiana]
MQPTRGQRYFLFGKTKKKYRGIPSTGEIGEGNEGNGKPNQDSTPPTPPNISEEPAPVPPNEVDTVQGDVLKALTDTVAVLSDQIQALSTVETEDA